MCLEQFMGMGFLIVEKKKGLFYIKLKHGAIWNTNRNLLSN